MQREVCQMETENRISQSNNRVPLGLFSWTRCDGMSGVDSFPHLGHGLRQELERGGVKALLVLDKKFVVSTLTSKTRS